LIAYKDMSREDYDNMVAAAMEAAEKGEDDVLDEF
jgi:hypothetical protein